MQVGPLLAVEYVRDDFAGAGAAGMTRTAYQRGSGVVRRSDLALFSAKVARRQLRSGGHIRGEDVVRVAVEGLAPDQPLPGRLPPSDY